MMVLEQRFMERVPNLLHDISESLKTIAACKQAVEPESYVWVFTAEQAYCSETYDVVVRVFSTEDKAREFMHGFIHEDGDEPIVRFVERHGWSVEFDEPDHYMACEDMSYPECHVECTITKCKIE